MLTNQTTFVIGAGASKDFGFPLGDGLRDQIVALLASNPTRNSDFKDPLIARLMQARATQEAGVNGWSERMDAYQQAAAIIRDGLPFARSIDSFLDGIRDEPEVQFLAKLAITTLILRSEAASPLIPYRFRAVNADQINADKLNELTRGWHSLLGQILYEGHTRETVDEVFKRVAFVIFNYDRVIEEFLTVSVMRRFAVNRTRALQAVSKCRFIHPYGQVGEFLPDKKGHVPFGQCDDNQLLVVAGGIRTFTEATEEHIADAVKDCISRAQTLVFLGFGWLPQNMQLLQVGDRLANATKIFATTMHLPSGEIEIISRQLDKVLRRGPFRPAHYQDSVSATLINDTGDCKDLLTHCWLRLTAA